MAVYSNETKNSASFTTQTPSVAGSFSNVSKNTSVFSSQSKTMNDLTWDEATISWDDINGTWDGQLASYTKQTKNSAVFANETKN